MLVYCPSDVLTLIVAVGRPPAVGLKDTSIGQLVLAATSARQPLVLIQKSLGLAPVTVGTMIAAGPNDTFVMVNAAVSGDGVPTSDGPKSAPFGVASRAG